MTIRQRVIVTACLVGGLVSVPLESVAAPVPQETGLSSSPQQHEHRDNDHDSESVREHQADADAADAPMTPVPPITEAARMAAFPILEMLPMHERTLHTLVQFDELEWQDVEAGALFSWDGHGWFGGDRHRLWFRTEGAADADGVDDVEAHLLYGRPVARWWDLVVGVRQDVRPGPAQTWAAVGVQGLAPYWFEIEATGYVSDRGQTAVRLEAEYELLFTNRLMLQPRIELNLYGKSHVARGIGAGLSALETELRLRYEVRRELAPYVGMSWHRLVGETRDLATIAGKETGGVRAVAGVRVWY